MRSSHYYSKLVSVHIGKLPFLHLIKIFMEIFLGTQKKLFQAESSLMGSFGAFLV